MRRATSHLADPSALPEPHSCSRRTPEPQWYGTLSGRHRAGRIGGNTIGRLNDTTLFVGDLAYNRMHAYLADGYWRDWLTLLTRLERELPDDAVLHVGGDPGTKSLLATQRRYVEAFVEAVREHADAVTAGDHPPVVQAMQAPLPTEALLFLMDLSFEPLLAELRAEGAPDGGNAASEN